MNEHDSAVIALHFELKLLTEKAMGNAAVMIMNDYPGVLSPEEIVSVIQRTMAKQVLTRPEIAQLILKAWANHE